MSNQEDSILAIPPEEILGRLEPHALVLLEVKEKLYEGSWARMLEDLQARLSGRPFVYKLSQTIQRDIAAIELMRAYEARHSVALAQLARKAKGEAG